MNQEEIRTFLSKLTNTELTNDSVLTLSSAQKARLYNWCQENHVNINLQKINGRFSINDLSDETDLLKSNNSKGLEHKINNLSGASALPANIGVDIQSINELFPISLESDLKDREDFKSIFTIRELSYAQSRIDMRQTLTGIFAAKEAIVKCQYGEINLLDIEVLPNNFGKPSYKNFLVSISHSGEYAIAIAMNNGSQNGHSSSLQDNLLPYFFVDDNIAKKKSFFSSRIRILDLFFIVIILVIILFK